MVEYDDVEVISSHKHIKNITTCGVIYEKLTGNGQKFSYKSNAVRKIQTYSFKDQRRNNTSNSEAKRMAWELPALNFSLLVIMDPLNNDDD